MGIGVFFNENSLLKLRLVIYGILIILSFFVFVGVLVMVDNEKGKCPLYIDIRKSFFIYKEDDTTCNYPIAIAVIFQLVFLLLRMVSLILVVVGKLSKDTILFSNIFEFLYVVIDLAAFLMTFVGACILTEGSREADDHPYPFDWIAASKVAQGGAWTSAILWLIIGLIGLYVLKKAGKIPCFGGQQQNSPEPKEEMRDPASERFGV